MNIFDSVSKKIYCLFFNHDWRFHGTHFYCVDKYPKFDKLWQDYYSCSLCGLKITPKWFNKNWRIKNQLAIFCADDLSLNLNSNEIEAYKKTVNIIKLLNNKENLNKKLEEIKK